MKLIKKITAVLLVCIMAFSLTACHPKDEIAVTINGYEFTSAYYMCAFVNAYLEGQQEVIDNLSEDESYTDIDYSKQTIDGKKFEQWVKDTAIDTLKQVANYKTLCDKNGVKMSEDDKAANEYYASMYWSSYGYADVFEPNGVSLATFTNYMNDEYYSTLYFENLYGKDGAEEIPAKTVKSKLYNDFIIADILEYTYSSDAGEDELKNTIKKFKEYADYIESGKLTFEEAYNEFNEIEEDTEEDTEESEEHDLAEPKDAYASVIGADGTGYEHDYYNDIKKMEIGEIKVIEMDDDAGCILVIKQDIEADDYYLEEMDMTVRHLLKDAEYTEKMDEEAKKLEAEINKYAVNQFKVKKIVEPDYGY